MVARPTDISARLTPIQGHRTASQRPNFYQYLDTHAERRVSDFGSFASPSLQNAPLKGAQSVLDRYAQQILQTIERDDFYVRVPAGKEFYLYLTQTLDRADARIGGTAFIEAASDEPAEEADHETARVPFSTAQRVSLRNNPASKN